MSETTLVITVDSQSGIGESKPPTTAGPTTERSGTTSTTTGVESVGATDQTMLPWQRAGAAHTDPVDAVEEFVDFIGFGDDADIGEFRQGDARSGEVEIAALPPDEPGLEISTIALLRLNDAGNWIVFGAVSDVVVIDDPLSDAIVSSPVDIHFIHNLGSARLTVQLWPDGAAHPIVDEPVTSASDVVTLGSGDAVVEWGPPITGPATAIFRSGDASVTVAVTTVRLDLAIPAVAVAG